MSFRRETSPYHCDDALVKTTNDMLASLHVNTRVKHWREIDANVFVTLFEGLTGEALQVTISDVVRRPTNKEEEVRNVQAVIDTLSLDVLNTSLSHITGDSIVEGDKVAISNLLEVFSGLLEYIMDKITSDVSCDDEDSKVGLSPAYDREEMTQDSMVDTEVGRRYNTSRFREQEYCAERNSVDNASGLVRLGHSMYPDDLFSSPPIRQTTGNSTAELIREAEDYERNPTVLPPNPYRTNANMPLEEMGPDPARARYNKYPSSPDSSSSNPSFLYPLVRNAGKFATIGQRPTRDSANSQVKKTASNKDNKTDTSRLSKSRSNLVTTSDNNRQRNSTLTDKNRERNSIHSTTADRKTRPSSLVNDRPKSVQHTFTHHLYHHYDRENPVNSKYSSKDPRNSGDGRNQQRSRTGANSYEPLENMVQKTVAMSRAALKPTSSSSKTETSSLTTTEVDEEALSEALRTTLQNVEKESKKLDTLTRQKTPARASNSTGDNMSQSSHPTPSRLKRVSFLSIRHEDIDSNQNARDGEGGSEPLSERGSKEEMEQLAAYKSAEEQFQIMKQSADPDATAKNGTTSSPTPRKAAEDFEPYTSAYPSTDEYYPEEMTNERGDRTMSRFAQTQSKKGKKGRYLLEEDYENDSILGSPGMEAALDAYAVALKERSAYRNPKSGKKGQVGVKDLKKKIADEDKQRQIKQGYLENAYCKDLQDYQEEMKQLTNKMKKKAQAKEKEFRKDVMGKSPPYSALKKKYTKKYYAKSRAGRKFSGMTSDACTRYKLSKAIPDSEILPFLLDECPHLQLSAETLRTLWRRGAKQVELLANIEGNPRVRLNKSNNQISEAERKQQLLIDIMQKDVAYQQRLTEMRERKSDERIVAAKTREQRSMSARSRKYYEQYQLAMRSKMLTRSSKEEMIFRKLFQEGLQLQKERVHELRKYSKDQREKNYQKQQGAIESLENYYREQFGMIAECMAKEKRDLDIRERAQSKILKKMKVELRRKMEKEIQTFQEIVNTDRDDVHFREMDANRIKQELDMVKFVPPEEGNL